MRRYNCAEKVLAVIGAIYMVWLVFSLLTGAPGPWGINR